MGFPEEFCHRMENILGQETEAFFTALELPPERAFRFDEKKVSLQELNEAFGEKIGEKIPFDSSAFRFLGEGIGNSPYHHGGALYVQEPCAMAPVAALGEEKANRILDLCAAPGGKSLQAAAHVLSENGLLISNEPEGKRRKTLMQNVERLGEKRCQVTGFDGSRLPKNWEGSFDLVICDAPCSGEGMMRKSETAKSEWSLENVRLCAKRQKDILSEAARCLAPGGRLLYSTCTWAPEENEEVVAHLLSTRSDLSLLPPDPRVRAISAEGLVGYGLETKNLCRFYPHLFRGEGQFCAIFQKEGEPLPQKEKKEKKKGKPDPNLKVVEAFLKETLTDLPEEEIFLRGDEAYLLPKGGIDPKDTVSPGVLVGAVQKGRIIPHHRFFLAFASLFQNKIHLAPSDPRIEAYLRGEEIPLEGKKGYGVIFAGSCPLGGVKCSDGRGKNLYPKGLRKV